MTEGRRGRSGIQEGTRRWYCIMNGHHQRFGNGVQVGGEARHVCCSVRRPSRTRLAMASSLLARADAPARLGMHDGLLCPLTTHRGALVRPNVPCWRMTAFSDLDLGSIAWPAQPPMPGLQSHHRQCHHRHKSRVKHARKEPSTGAGSSGDARGADRSRFPSRTREVVDVVSTPDPGRGSSAPRPSASRSLGPAKIVHHPLIPYAVSLRGYSDPAHIPQDWQRCRAVKSVILDPDMTTSLQLDEAVGKSPAKPIRHCRDCRCVQAF